MSRISSFLRWSALLALAVFVAVPASTPYFVDAPVAFADDDDNDNNNNNNNDNDNDNDNDNGGGSGDGSGVVVRPDGVLERVILDDGTLAAMRQAALYGVPSEMKAVSKARKVSLTRLEAAIQENGGVVTADMANLAGLTRIENVYVYPESGEIVLSGPAEGWTIGAEGATVGVRSGRPTLKLEDLVVALRAFPAEGKGNKLVGCSIDPTAEGLRNMQAYLKNTPHPNLSDDGQIVDYALGMADALGLQNVQVWGVSPKTNFAATLVAADYRMKLIGIGLEEAPVKLTTYAERSNPRGRASNALVRWYFQPDYDCVVMTEDGTAMQLVGNGVNLVGENELVDENGNRSANKNGGNPATKAYAKSFTAKFDRIADAVPVYANLRNMIDMSIVAAYLQKEGAYAKTGWDMAFLGDEAQFKTERLNAIQFAQTATNAVRRSATLVSYPTGGGVVVRPATALDEDNLKYDEKGEVEAKRDAVASSIPEGQWWWD